MAKAAKKKPVASRKPRFVTVKVPPRDIEKTMKEAFSPDSDVVGFTFEGGYDGSIKATARKRVR